MSGIKTYVSQRQVGKCQICRQEKDLRYGACFKCSDQIEGEQLNDGTHQLWDTKNPSNFWFVSETGQ